MKYENNDLSSLNHKNYSELDGCDLSKIETSTIQFNSEKACIKCDEIYDDTSLYCKKCGNELVSIKGNSKNLNPSDVLKQDSKIIESLKTWVHKTEIKRRIVVPAIAIFTLLIISMWIKLFMSFIGLEINKFFNIFNIVLGFNLVPIKLASSYLVGVGNVDIRMSLIVLLIVPFICIGVLSSIFIKKESLQDKNIIEETIKLSFIYGLLLGIISIIGKQFINFSMSEYYTMSLSIKYSFLRSVLNGTIIAFLPIYIVMFTKLKPQKEIFKIINKVLKTIFLIYSVILILLVIGLFTNKVFLSNRNLIGFITYPQLAIYILHLVNLIPIGIANGMISIFNINDIGMYLNESMTLLIYAMILLNIVILVVSGYDIKNKFKNKNSIKYFSFIYSIVIACTIYLSKIDTSGSLSLLDVQNINMYSHIGSSIILGMIISFLYSYILLSLGYRLNKE